MESFIRESFVIHSTFNQPFLEIFKQAEDAVIQSADKIMFRIPKMSPNDAMILSVGLDKSEWEKMKAFIDNQFIIKP